MNNHTPIICASSEELIQHIQPGQKIFVQGATATPEKVLAALALDHARLKGSEVMHLHTHGPAAYGEHKEFNVVNLFVGENLRKRIDYEHIDYLPCFMSEIPALFRKGIRTPDVAIVQVSPPDSHGFCSLGTSVDVTKAAVDTAKIVLAQINPRMPRTYGAGMIPLSRFTATWLCDSPLIGSQPKAATSAEIAIAKFVASLIEDGSTLQMGIGAVPDCVLAELCDRRHLGVHTEMFSDGLIPLIQCGAVDNSRKYSQVGQTVTTFVNGTERLFAFIHDNPSILFLESDYVNRAEIIARHPKVISINSAVEIDLTGQVVADSIGHRVISGVGGQMDFVRGSTLSEGGKSIIALPSRTKSGFSRIVHELKAGAGVVTTRAHVHFVVTEYGIADLYGKTLGERAKALINIAHPEDRETLRANWWTALKG